MFPFFIFSSDAKLLPSHLVLSLKSFNRTPRNKSLYVYLFVKIPKHNRLHKIHYIMAVGIALNILDQISLDLDLVKDFLAQTLFVCLGVLNIKSVGSSCIYDYTSLWFPRNSFKHGYRCCVGFVTMRFQKLIG